MVARERREGTGILGRMVMKCGEKTEGNCECILSKVCVWVKRWNVQRGKRHQQDREGKKIMHVPGCFKDFDHTTAESLLTN